MTRGTHGTTTILIRAEQDGRVQEDLPGLFKPVKSRDRTLRCGFSPLHKFSGDCPDGLGTGVSANDVSGSRFDQKVFVFAKRIIGFFKRSCYLSLSLSLLLSSGFLGAFFLFLHYSRTSILDSPCWQ